MIIFSGRIFAFESYQGTRKDVTDGVRARYAGGPSVQLEGGDYDDEETMEGMEASSSSSSSSSGAGAVAAAAAAVVVKAGA